VFSVDLGPAEIDLLASALASAIEALPVRTEVA
jgi:hypothetical protein